MGIRRIGRCSLAFCLLITACRTSPPRTQYRGPLHWPEGWTLREDFAVPGLHLLASSQSNAEEGLRLLEAMLEDLEPWVDAPLAEGVVLIIGEDDPMDQEMGKRISAALLSTESEERLNQALDKKGSLNSEDGGIQMHLGQLLRMGPIPLEKDRLLALLDWRPEEQPLWALSLPTQDAVEDQLGDMLEEQGYGGVARAAFFMLAGDFFDSMRKEGFTPAFLKAAYPQQSPEERERILKELRGSPLDSIKGQ